MPATVQSPMPTQWAGWRASSIPCCFRSRSATMRYSLMRRHDRQLRLCRGLTLALMMFPTLVHAERLKDLADVQGVRSNPLEIGRASCRERVCQYVEISGVAVSLKKKKETITKSTTTTKT